MEIDDSSQSQKDRIVLNQQSGYGNTKAINETMMNKQSQLNAIDKRFDKDHDE